MTLKEPQPHSGPKESQRYLHIVKQGLRYLYTHPHLWSLAINSTIVATAAYFVIWLYQPLLISLDVPIGYFGLIHGALVLAQIAVASQFERLTKLFKVWSYEKVSALLVMVGFLSVALYPSLLTVALMIILAGGFGLTRATYIGTEMNAYIESHQRATVLSSISMLRRLALVFFNPLIGVLVDNTLPGALFVLGLLPVMSLVFKTPKKE